MPWRFYIVLAFCHSRDANRQTTAVDVWVMLKWNLGLEHHKSSQHAASYRLNSSRSSLNATSRGTPTSLSSPCASTHAQVRTHTQWLEGGGSAYELHSGRIRSKCWLQTDRSSMVFLNASDGCTIGNTSSPLIYNNRIISHSTLYNLRKCYSPVK